MKIYYEDTPNGYKTCAVAEQLQVPVEFVRINLVKLSRNTLMQPTLAKPFPRNTLTLDER